MIGWFFFLFPWRDKWLAHYLRTVLSFHPVWPLITSNLPEFNTWRCRYRSHRKANQFKVPWPHAAWETGARWGSVSGTRYRWESWDGKWWVQMIVMRRVSGSGGTRWHERLLDVGFLCGAHQGGEEERGRARVRKAHAGHVGPRESWGFFLPRFPLIFKLPISPTWTPLSSAPVLSLSVSLFIFSLKIFSVLAQL